MKKKRSVNYILYSYLEKQFKLNGQILLKPRDLNKYISFDIFIGMVYINPNNIHYIKLLNNINTYYKSEIIFKDKTKFYLDVLPSTVYKQLESKIEFVYL